MDLYLFLLSFSRSRITLDSSWSPGSGRSQSGAEGEQNAWTGEPQTELSQTLSHHAPGIFLLALQVLVELVPDAGDVAGEDEWQVLGQVAQGDVPEGLSGS